MIGILSALVTEDTIYLPGKVSRSQSNSGVAIEQKVKYEQKEKYA